jgi:hypothetical protein
LGVAEVKGVADGGLAMAADEDHFVNEISLGQCEGECGTNPAEPDDRNFHG